MAPVKRHSLVLYVIFAQMQNIKIQNYSCQGYEACNMKGGSWGSSQDMLPPSVDSLLRKTQNAPPQHS